MKPTSIEGVFQKGDKLYTQNLQSCRGIKVYNERLVHYNNKEFRSWNPYRSKLAAAILKKLRIPINADSTVLYLGAATGTTVSHISDIVAHGMVYAVENSPLAASELIRLCKKRQNVIPIVEDANHPERYRFFLSSVDFLYQDISQRNQAEIFFENIQQYLKKDGAALLMVKARSIDVSLPPEKAYEMVADKLRAYHLTLVDIVDLAAYERDHAAIVVSF